MEYGTTGAGLGAAFIAVVGIWSLVALAVYVWYLWSLSRLFPWLGLPGGWGWIPLWNQWQLIQRAGLPGWIVLIGIIPGLGVVVLIFSIIAIHRLNTEFGKTVGFTVLGVFLPPIWAMLLANHIGDQSYANGSHWPAGSPVAMATRSSTTGNASEWAASPGAGQSADGGQAAQGIQTARGTQSAQWRGLPPVPPGPEMHAGTEAGAHPAYAPRQPGFAPPVPPAAGQPSPASNPWAPPVTSAAGGVGPSLDQFPAVVPPAPSAPPAPGQGAGQPVAPTPGVPGEPPSVANNWGFGKTTEGEFERLAAEGAPTNSSAQLGPQEPQRPYSWPEATSGSAPLSPRPAVDADSSPIVLPEPVERSGPSIFDVPVPQQPAAPAARVPDPPAQPTPSHSGQLLADDEDHTVVVSKRSRWGFELPGGEVVELLGDNVVVGRKPEALPGSIALQIADPTRTMSKSHVRMRRTGEAWTIEDLNSTNGVAVINEAGEPVDVAPGSETDATERMVIGTLEVRLRRID